MSTESGVERAGAALRVRGPVTMASVEALLQQGRIALQDGTSAVIDLSGVTDVDSSSVSMLLQWMREARRRGQQFALVHVPQNIRTLVTLYGVSELLPSERVNEPLSSVQPTTGA